MDQIIFMMNARRTEANFLEPRLAQMKGEPEPPAAANGNIVTAADSVTGTWTYSYDSLNRLTSASASAGPCSGMNIAWGYDRHGNRTSQSASGSSPCTISEPTLSFTGANNHIDGWSYDTSWSGRRVEFEKIPGAGQQEHRVRLGIWTAAFITAVFQEVLR